MSASFACDHLGKAERLSKISVGPPAGLMEGVLPAGPERTCPFSSRPLAREGRPRTGRAEDPRGNSNHVGYVNYSLGLIMRAETELGDVSIGPGQAQKSAESAQSSLTASRNAAEDVTRKGRV